MSISNAQRDAEVAQMGTGGNNTSPVLGYGDPVATAGPLQFRDPSEPVQTTVMAPEPITLDRVSAVLSGLTAEDQALLAIDMFAVGVYENINYMFDENNNIDQQYFVKTVSDTINLAATSTELGLDTDFLDVLLRNYGNTSESLSARLAEAKAAATSGGGGRVINYIDPFALADAAKKATASVTGRMATPEEQQAFVKMVHGLQASGMSGISVGARAEAFAREQRPNEAGAMDYANAAGSLMQVLGIGGR